MFKKFKNYKFILFSKYDASAVEYNPIKILYQILHKFVYKVLLRARLQALEGP